MKDIQWCKVIDMTKGANLLTMIIETIKETPLSAFIVGFCEKIGEVKVYNVSLSDTILIK